MFAEDVTAGDPGVLYNIVDATTGGSAGGIPVNHNTWTENYVTVQTQVDMTTANASTSVDWDSDTTVFYYFQPTAATPSFWALDFNTTSTAAPNIPQAPIPTKPYAVLRVHDSGADLADIFGLTATTPTCDPVTTLVYSGCNWTAFDHWVSQASTASATLMYTFHKTPNWAGSWTSSPPNDTYFVNMLKAIRDRAGCTAVTQTGCIQYWEVWNEPNNDGGSLSLTSSGTPYWSGSVENLVHVARLVHDHVKTPANGGVDGVDPNAMVVGPGSAGWGTYTNLPGGNLTLGGACVDATWSSNLNAPEAFNCEYLRRAGSGAGDLTGAYYTDAITLHLYPNATTLSTIAEANIQTRVTNIKKAFTDLGITPCPHGTRGNGAGSCTQLFASEDSWGGVSSGTYPRIGPDATNSAQVSGSGLSGSWPDDQSAYLVKEYLMSWSLGLDMYTWYGWDFQNGWGNLLCKSSNAGIGCDTSIGAFPYQQKPAGAFGAIQKWMTGRNMSGTCSSDGNTTWSCNFTGPYGYKAKVLWNSAQTGVLMSVPGYSTKRDMYGTVTSFGGTVTPNYYPVVIERTPNVSRISGGWQ
jgi:hypothetical protein